jgi:1-aminocyclopropane-1-carboxylate deaminase
LDPKPLLQNINSFSQYGCTVDTLRLDQIHPIVSGNKWYKLRYYIQAALDENASSLASFGGPYSNHLVALAFAAKEKGLKSIGYVRSNLGEPITPSLQEALDYGMELIYLGRTHFQTKKQEIIQANTADPNSKTYLVDEGGYGNLGALGASTIMKDMDVGTSKTNPLYAYDTIICAVGTGTMIAGIINAAAPHQKIIGIPVLKNEGSIEQEIKYLMPDPLKPFQLLHQFHQGGYAKTSPEQIHFMNAFWDANKIPTDIVYTGKVFYAVSQLLQDHYFKDADKILVIHSGGLQGNRSLTKVTLKF